MFPFHCGMILDVERLDAYEYESYIRTALCTTALVELAFVSQIGLGYRLGALRLSSLVSRRQLTFETRGRY